MAGTEIYIARIAKIVMVACLALFCLLVVFSSLHDYQTNFLFVKNLMSMETTFPGIKLRYRAITTPELWHATFAIVIFGEALAGLLFLVGAYFFFRVRHAPGAVFDLAKSWTIAGALVAYLVWFSLFMVFAGEWFVMWQSESWNGQEAAFRFYLTVMAVLIFVVLPDRDLEAKARAKDSQPANRRAAETDKTHEES